MQMVVPSNADTTYWCHAVQLPQELVETEHFVIKVSLNNDRNGPCFNSIIDILSNCIKSHCFSDRHKWLLAIAMER